MNWNDFIRVQWIPKIFRLQWQHSTCLSLIFALAQHHIRRLSFSFSFIYIQNSYKKKQKIFFRWTGKKKSFVSTKMIWNNNNDTMRTVDVAPDFFSGYITPNANEPFLFLKNKTRAISFVHWNHSKFYNCILSVRINANTISFRDYRESNEKHHLCKHHKIQN